MKIVVVNASAHDGEVALVNENVALMPGEKTYLNVDDPIMVRPAALVGGKGEQWRDDEGHILAAHVTVEYLNVEQRSERVRDALKKAEAADNALEAIEGNTAGAEPKGSVWLEVEGCSCGGKKPGLIPNADLLAEEAVKALPQFLKDFPVRRSLDKYANLRGSKAANGCTLDEWHGVTFRLRDDEMEESLAYFKEEHIIPAMKALAAVIKETTSIQDELTIGKLSTAALDQGVFMAEASDPDTKLSVRVRLWYDGPTADFWCGYDMLWGSQPVPSIRVDDHPLPKPVDARRKLEPKKAA